MNCPKCNIKLLCGCKACIIHNLNYINSPMCSLLVWVGDDAQACMNCGHMMHCDQWLEHEIRHMEELCNGNKRGKEDENN